MCLYIFDLYHSVIFLIVSEFDSDGSVVRASALKPKGRRFEARLFPRVLAVWHPFTQSEYFVGRAGHVVRLSQCANRLPEMYAHWGVDKIV